MDWLSGKRVLGSYKYKGLLQDTFDNASPYLRASINMPNRRFGLSIHSIFALLRWETEDDLA